MPADWENRLENWVSASLIDASTAGRIRTYEAEHAASQGLRWPVLLALAFGGILLTAGILLFVAAHWDTLSPAARFTLLVVKLAALHVGGAFAAPRSEAFATVLHGIGTIALGAGISLAGQIFHLQAHWPSGILLWASGAWIGWALRRDWVQGALAALLTPAWLTGEWSVATENFTRTGRVMTEGLLLLAFTYLTAQIAEKATPLQRALVWMGGLALIPCTISTLVLFSPMDSFPSRAAAPASLAALGWSVALGLPLALAAVFRGRSAWMNLPAALWVVVLGTFRTDQASVYLWCALGSIGLAGWGLTEARKERINLGVAGFALTVLLFYFSTVMDKLDRSVSLIGLGVLFLGGGWALERTRRRLVARL